MDQTFLFGKLRILNYRDEPCVPVILLLLSSQIKVNTFFKNINQIKRKILDENLHKAMKITVNIYLKNKKFFITVQQKNVCRLKFADNLWLPFFDQPQSDI